MTVTHMSNSRFEKALSKFRAAVASVGVLALAGCTFTGPGESDLEALLKSCQYTHPKIISQNCKLMAHGLSYECVISFKPHVDVEVVKNVRMIVASGQNGWMMIEREDL